MGKAPGGPMTSSSADRNTPALTRYAPKPGKAASSWRRLGLPEPGRALEERIAAGISYDVFERLIAVTGFSEQELREVAGIPRSSLQRREREGRFSPTESDRLYRVAEVWLAAIRLWSGDAQAARAWLTRPAKGLGRKRPIDLLQTMLGTQQVLDLIGRLEYGVVA